MATNTSEAPDYREFHRSVTDELYSVKDRIRNLVRHWPTDGESKEVALRSVLRRHLPLSVTIGRGFIVTPTASSSQIDILIVDSSKPTLFKDGDLLVVTPDAVLGVIEVKTELRGQSEMATAVEKLSAIECMCHEWTQSDSVWTGLFVFEESGGVQETGLVAVGRAYRATRRPVNCVSVGRNTFIRYWPHGEMVNSAVPDAVWHSYDLQGVAPSYFMGNLIDFISSVDRSKASFAWFPLPRGKESHRRFFLRLGESRPERY